MAIILLYLVFLSTDVSFRIFLFMGALFLFSLGAAFIILETIEQFKISEKISLTIKKRFLINSLLIVLGIFFLEYPIAIKSKSIIDLFFLLSAGLLFFLLATLVFSFTLIKLNIRIKLKPAKSDELLREDEVLMETTAFLQGILFIYLNLIKLPTSFAAYFIFNISIPVSGIVFFILRGFARIWNDNNMRYKSIYFLMAIFFIDYTFFISIFQFPQEISIVWSFLITYSTLLITYGLVSFARSIKIRYKLKTLNSQTNQSKNWFQ